MSWICAFWSGHVGAAAGCCFRVLLLEWRVRCGLNCHCRCEVPQGVTNAASSDCCQSAVRVLSCLWSWLAGAARRVGVHGTTMYCQGADGVVCILRTSYNLIILRLSYKFCCRIAVAMKLVLLQWVAARCLWQRGRWALMEITFTP